MYSRTLASMIALPGERQIPTIPFIRCMGSCSLSQTVGLPSDARSMRCVHGHIGGRAMVLRPVELDAAGNPRTQQPNQRWLDHVLPVKEVVLICFVQTSVNSPADFRKNHQMHVFVFEKDRSVITSCFSRDTRSVNRVRINLAAASLVNPLLKKHWIRIGVLDRIGRNDDLLFPAADWFGFVGSTHQTRTSASWTWPPPWVPINQEHGHGGGTFTLTYTYIHPLSMTQRTPQPPPRKRTPSLADIVPGLVTVLFLQPLDRRSFGRRSSPLSNPVVKHREPVVRREKVGINFDGLIHLPDRIAVALFRVVNNATAMRSGR